MILLCSGHFSFLPPSQHVNPIGGANQSGSRDPGPAGTRARTTPCVWPGQQRKNAALAPGRTLVRSGEEKQFPYVIFLMISAPFVYLASDKKKCKILRSTRDAERKKRDLFFYPGNCGWKNTNWTPKSCLTRPSVTMSTSSGDPKAVVAAPEEGVSKLPPVNQASLLYTQFLSFFLSFESLIRPESRSTSSALFSLLGNFFSAPLGGNLHEIKILLH